jgi:lipid-A-disaccharide synthase
LRPPTKANLFSTNIRVKKIFLLAGEASGDLHAAEVVRNLKRLRPDADVFGVAGSKSEDAGMRLLFDYRRINFMGFVEVAKHYRFLRGVINNLKETVLVEKPDVAVLVDYPGMNLILAKFFKQHNIPVVYYISPQVWAWKEGRVKTIRECVAKMLVVFEFEVEFYKRHGISATFVGHPILEEILHVTPPDKVAFLRQHHFSPTTKLIGLLPGSRPQELRKMMPVMLKAAELVSKKFDAAFLLATAPSLDDSVYAPYLAGSPIQPVKLAAYDAMQLSDFAFVTSGTATLESLCFGLPMAVCYKTGRLNYAIGRQLVKIKNISLANIVGTGLYSSERLVPELLQADLTPEKLFDEANKILSDDTATAALRHTLLQAKAKLGTGNASENAASEIVSLLGK